MAGGCSVGCGSLPHLGAVAAVNSADRARAKSPSPAPPLAQCATFSSFLFLSAYSGYATIYLCVLCLGDSSRLAGRSLVEASSLSAISVRAVFPIPITRCSFAINLYPLIRYRLSHLSGLVGSRDCSFSSLRRRRRKQGAEAGTSISGRNNGQGP